MEYFDICDAEGKPTGDVVERTVAHATGVRHRTAHVWIVRKKNGADQILLQKRSEGKDSFPGCYDTSSAGHVPAGYEPKESALRELEEELGIVACEEDLHFIDTFPISYETVFYGKAFKDEEIAYVFVYKKDVDESKLTLQKEEVEAVKWFDMKDLIILRHANDPSICVPSGGLNLIVRYLRKLKESE